MIKDKRINYVIGIILGACLLGFLALPFVGGASGYELIDLLELMNVLNQREPLIIAAVSLIICSIVFASILIILGLSGFVLKFTKYKDSKLEKVVSWIYSSVLIAIIALCMSIFILIIVWVNKASLEVGSGFFVFLGLIVLLPYFATTKMNIVFLIYIVIFTGALGFVFYIIQDKIGKNEIKN